jgi:hypothetical protein
VEVVTAVIAAGALVVGYILGFVREVILEGRRERRDADARREARRVARDERQRVTLTALQDHLQAFGRTLVRMHQHDVAESHRFKLWTKSYYGDEILNANMEAKSQIQRLKVRIADAELRQLVDSLIAEEARYLRAQTRDEADEAKNTAVATVVRIHNHIGDVLRGFDEDV